MKSSKKVAVIGAGPMGLATAYELGKNGFYVDLFEKSEQLGGMTASFDFSGINIERFYHFHCTSDKDFFDLLDELNLKDKLVWKETKMCFWFNKRLQYWGNPLTLLKFRGISLVAKFRYGLHAFLSVKRSRAGTLDKKNAKDWIKLWVGQEAWDKLWKNLFLLKFYQYSDNLSAAWIWSRIRRIGRSRYSIMKEKLGYIEGGSDLWINEIARCIKAYGGNIYKNSQVHSIMSSENKKYLVSVLHNTDFMSEDYDAVISTVPLPYVPQIFGSLLPSEIKKNFESKNNIGCCCVIVKLKKALTDCFWCNTNDKEMDIPGIIEYTNLNSLQHRCHIVYVPYYVPTDNPLYKDDDLIFKNKVKVYFKMINPNLTDDDFIDIVVSKYEFAQPICEPNYLSSLPNYRIDKNIYIADTSYYYPEDRGISESIGFGRKIAKELVLDLEK